MYALFGVTPPSTSIHGFTPCTKITTRVSLASKFSLQANMYLSQQAYLLGTHSSQVRDFLYLTLNKALPTESRVYRHNQDQINHCKHVRKSPIQFASFRDMKYYYFIIKYYYERQLLTEELLAMFQNVRVLQLSQNYF